MTADSLRFDLGSSGEAATVPAPHDPNHPYVLRHVGCGHGVLFTDPCVECEIVSLQEQYHRAVRTVATVRDRMRQLGRPMPGNTSGMHRVIGEPSRNPLANQAQSRGSPVSSKPKE